MPISDCCTEKELKKWRKEGYSDKEIYAWCREHPGRDAEGDWSPGAPPPPQRKEKDSNKSTTGAPPVDKASLPSANATENVEPQAASGEAIVFTFGKYKGSTIADVYAKDKSYLSYLTEEVRARPPVPAPRTDSSPS